MPADENHGATDAASDPQIERLAQFFLTHPAWIEAAECVDARATSRVRFRHRPSEPWRLVRRGEASVLEPGDTLDPDFEFVFSPGAIDRITRTEGGIGAFAVALFGCAVEEDPDYQVELRIVAPFTRLARRGYLRLLLAGGPAVIAFGARHGVRTLGELRRLVKRMRDGESR